MRTAVAWMCCLLAACDDPTDKANTPSENPSADADADGSPAGDDCDDNDPSVFPGADELCDGVDNDCDGAVDEGL